MKYYQHVNLSQRRSLDSLLGGGSLAYCSSAAYPPGSPTKPPTCQTAASKHLSMPNGVVKGRDGLYYVPSSISDDHKVMRLGNDGNLTPVGFIRVGMPIDNFAVDANGDLWAAAFPKLLNMAKHLTTPEHASPVAVFRIRRIGGWDGRKDDEGVKYEYEVDKLIEDDTGHVLSGSTVARHDAKTGRVFVGGELNTQRSEQVLTTCSCNGAVPRRLRPKECLMRWSTNGSGVNGSESNESFDRCRVFNVPQYQGSEGNDHSHRTYCACNEGRECPTCMIRLGDFIVLSPKLYQVCSAKVRIITRDTGLVATWWRFHISSHHC